MRERKFYVVTEPCVAGWLMARHHIPRIDFDRYDKSKYVFYFLINEKFLSDYEALKQNNFITN